MRRKLVYILLLAAVAVAGCRKAETAAELEPGAEAEVFYTAVVAAPAPESKTTINGMSPVWAVGDRVYVFDAEDPEGRNMVLTLGTDATITAGGNEFRFPQPKGYSPEIRLVYPASAFGSTSRAGGNITFRYDNQDGTFASANISVATPISDRILNFQNVTAILRFSGRSNPAIAAISVPEPSVGTVRLSSEIGTGPIYIAVPPTTFPCGSTFEFLDASEAVLSSRTVTAAAGNKVNVNKIYNLGVAGDN